MPLLCVQWKTPDDGQRNCLKHVEFYSKNKSEKLVHLVGFIIRIYHDVRSPERQKSQMMLNAVTMLGRTNPAPWYVWRFCHRPVRRANKSQLKELGETGKDRIMHSVTPTSSDGQVHVLKLHYLLTCMKHTVFPEKLMGPRNSQHFMESEGSLPQLQAPATCPLPWARSIQPMLPHHTSWRPLLILSSHLLLCLPSGLFPPGLTTKTLYEPLLSPTRATCSAQLILLDHLNIWWGTQNIKLLVIVVFSIPL